MKNTIKVLVVALTSLAFNGVQLCASETGHASHSRCSGNGEENGDEIRKGSGHGSYG